LDGRRHLGGLFLLLQLLVRQRSKDWHHFQPAIALAVSFWQGNIGVGSMAAMAIARQDGHKSCSMRKKCSGFAN
jgi:hypothetical protein